jgi:hypothetical protein
MPKFRKKPVIIEAEQFIAPNNIEGAMFMRWPVKQDKKGFYLIIPTLEGDHRADEGDWIITGVKGEQYPCKPDIFEATYETV